MPEEAAPAAAPAIDVSALAGASTPVVLGWRTAAGSVQTLCVLAPSSRWMPGLEALVFGRATQIATQGLAQENKENQGKSPEFWEPGPIGRETRGDPGSAIVLTQTIVGRTNGRVVAAIDHALAFTEGGSSAVLCSIACAGDAVVPGARRTSGSASPPSAPGPAATEGAFHCGEAWIQGDLAPEPAPGVAFRAVGFAAEHPAIGGAIAAITIGAVVAALLRFRPRVPFRRGDA